MKLIISGSALAILALLLIGSSAGGFINDPTESNDPDWTGSDVYICPFCNSTPFSLDDLLDPKTPAVTPAEPEPPESMPSIIIPSPVPQSTPDLASLLAQLKTEKLTSKSLSQYKGLFF